MRMSKVQVNGPSPKRGGSKPEYPEKTPNNQPEYQKKFPNNPSENRYDAFPCQLTFKPNQAFSLGIFENWSEGDAVWLIKQLKMMLKSEAEAPYTVLRCLQTLDPSPH